MPYKEYIPDRSCTNVRYFLIYTWNKIKLKISKYAFIFTQELDQKNTPIINDTKESEKNPEINPFQEDEQRTVFLSRLVEKVNLDMFNHLF